MFVPPAGVSIPLLAKVRDSADYSLTVQPYINELSAFSQSLFANLLNVEELQNLYATTNPLISALAFSLLISPIFIVLAEFNKNYSQVDRAWSILPAIYNAHYALWARINGVPSSRVNNMFFLSLGWSIRLTYNYWRKGGYNIGVEDYRWEVLRKKISPPLFAVFNIVFIGFAQNILLWAVTSPTYILLLSSQFASPLMVGADNLFIRTILLILGFEYIADQQQWDFHQAKTSYKETGKVPMGFTREDLERGFLVRGLWAWSRHPNFVAEQGFWIALYVWAAYVSESYLNWTIIGAVGYVSLFQGSTWFTEVITGGKYSDYKVYQKHVGMLLPNPFKISQGDIWKTPQSEKAKTPSKDAKE